MESMETALTMALLGVSVLPLVGDDSPPEEWTARPDAVRDIRDDAPDDDLDFESAFASY